MGHKVKQKDMDVGKGLVRWRGSYKSRKEIKRVGQRVTRMFEIVPKFSEIY